MNRPTPKLCALQLLLGVAMTAGVPSSAQARRAHIPVLVQVTHNTVGDVFNPAIRSQGGDSIVFVSTGDVTGPAPGHREVYFYDVTNRSLTRATTTSGGASYDASRETDSVHSTRPVFFAFISTGDLDPSIGNADHNPEVFIKFTETGQFMQVTDTMAPVVNAEAYASDSGKCLVFRSNGDLDDNDRSDSSNPGAGFSNSDASNEIFNVSFGDSDMSRSAWVFTQVSNGPAGTTSSHPVVGGYWFPRQCAATAYQSDHDQLGNGSSGMHVYNFRRVQGDIQQISLPGVGNNLNPNLSSASNFARGPFVVYQSDMDPIGNGTNVFEVFRYRLFKDELWQFSWGTADSARPAISDGGGRMAFESKGEHIDPRRVRSDAIPPFNPDGNTEMFLAISKSQIAQITRSQNCNNSNASVRDLGDSLAFRSTCNLIPNHNPNGVPQVFYFVNVASNDPLSTADGCKVVDGCCNEANGCFVNLFGRKILPPRAGIHPDWAN